MGPGAIGDAIALVRFHLALAEEHARGGRRDRYRAELSAAVDLAKVLRDDAENTRCTVEGCGFDGYFRLYDKSGTPSGGWVCSRHIGGVTSGAQDEAAPTNDGAPVSAAPAPEVT